MRKNKIWSTKVADAKFSLFIRTRDGRCLRPGCDKKVNLQCSHFWSRTRAITRYNPDNCITLCYGCHYGNSKGWELDKQGEYRDFMIKCLGLEGYYKLEKLARFSIPLYEAKKQLMQWLK